MNIREIVKIPTLSYITSKAGEGFLTPFSLFIKLHI